MIRLSAKENKEQQNMRLDSHESEAYLQDHNQNYTLSIFSESINPVFGNTFADSISSINFKTSKIIRFGSVIGKIKSEFPLNLILILKEIPLGATGKIQRIGLAKKLGLET